MSMAASFDDRKRARLAWAKSESEHLRRSRAIKSKYCHANKVCSAHYEVIRILGKGSFGVVRLVREINHRGSSDAGKDLLANGAEPPSSSVKPHRRDLSLLKKHVYAMKVIRKSDMLRNSQEGHLRAERDFLVASAHSHWVVPLISAFQDRSYLYLVMEYMVGGDFLGLLMREDILPEATARWYIAEMILCIEEAHKIGWIHRDVKPDNFLIGADGHLKISDFGLAFDGHWAHWQQYHNGTREDLLERCNVQIRGDADDIEKNLTEENARRLGHAVTGQSHDPRASFSARPGANDMIVDQLNMTAKRRLAKSIVGTSQYMAPEVIEGDYYDGRCDWWSIGIILYECVYGCTPFYDADRERIKAKIIEHRKYLVFPFHKRYNRPQAPERALLPPVTHTAIDLILQLLADKEKRLSSRRYRDNDTRGRQGPRNGRYRPQHQAYFVFANDTEEIKAHPFFHCIEWETLHLSRPPFIPRVSSDQPITKYFEDEEVFISHSDLSSSEESSEPTTGDTIIKRTGLAQLAAGGGDGTQTSATAPALPKASSLPWLHPSKLKSAGGSPCLTPHRSLDTRPSPTSPLNASTNPPSLSSPPNAANPSKNPAKKRRKEKRRPRDKILRDPDAAKTAMEIRKAAAFLGYTYRRPDMSALLGVGLDEDCEWEGKRRGSPARRMSGMPLVEVAGGK